LTTQAVMIVSPVERPVASAAYGFVRFIGGGLAPYVAGRLALRYNIHVPFLLGAVSMLIAIAVLSTGHRLLTDAERAVRAGAPEQEENELGSKELGSFVLVGAPGTADGNAADGNAADGNAADGNAADGNAAGGNAAGGKAPIVLAVDDGPAASAATAKAASIALERGTSVDLLHVHETDVIADSAVDRESLAAAQALVAARLDELTAAGVTATGYVMRSVADHASIGELIAGYANRVHAELVVIGEPTTGAFARILDGSSSARLIADATFDVLVVQPVPSV
jgi:MFS transporter, ACDE family, multidrug resistance protein